MCASVENNLRILRECSIDDDGNTVQISEWRHCAGLAVGKEKVQVLFMCEMQLLCSQRFAQKILVNALVCAKDGHPKTSIGAHNNRLGELIAGNMSGPGIVVRRERRVVRNYLVLNFVVIQIFRKVSYLCHGIPPNLFLVNFLELIS
jgi:hypothetical protein